MQGVGVIRKISKILPQNSLITIYKSFERPHQEVGDVLYDQPNNETLCQKTERVQYNATLAIMGIIKGTSQMKIHDELGLESFKFRQWFIETSFVFQN